MNKRFFIFLAAFFCCFFAYGQKSQPKSDFEAALFYFRANKPHDAIELFEKALENPDVDSSAYVYLGVSYFQIGEYQKSFEICKRGISVSGTDKKILALNAGNAAFAMESYAGAEEYYRRSLAEDSEFIPAILNLANTLVEEGKYAEAIPPYEKFLEIAKDDPQVPAVEEILRKLRAQLEKYKDNEPQLVSIDDVEYLNRKDREEAEEARRNQRIAFERVNADYFLTAKDEGIFLVKEERYIDDYAERKERFEYKIQEAELYIDTQEFDRFKKESDKMEKVVFEDQSEKFEVEPLEPIRLEKVVIRDEKVEGEKFDAEILEPIKFEKVIVREEKTEGEKIADEYYVLKIEDEKITIEKENGEKLNHDEFDIGKFLDEGIENLKVEKGSLTVLDDDGGTFDMKIEDEKLLDPEETPEPIEPEAALTVSAEFTPDGDGENDVAKIRLNPVMDPREKVVSWEVTITDERGAVIKTFKGTGDVPEVLEFDGKCDDGRELTSATDYPIHAKIFTNNKNTLEVDGVLSTGILVTKDGDRLKINVPGINFDSNAATMNSLTPEQLENNNKILTMVAKALRKYSGYGVTVEGHANSTTGTEKEEREELIPLSEARAKTVVQILAEKGIEKERMKAVGIGGRKPIAKGKDSWRNRRVEFILEK